MLFPQDKKIPEPAYVPVREYHELRRYLEVNDYILTSGLEEEHEEAMKEDRPLHEEKVLEIVKGFFDQFWEESLAGYLLH